MATVAVGARVAVGLRVATGAVVDVVAGGGTATVAWVVGLGGAVVVDVAEVPQGRISTSTSKEKRSKYECTITVNRAMSHLQL